MSTVDLLLIAIAGFASGAINALAGGGSLVLFPVLLGTGLSPLAANVTNTVAAWPGTAGGVLGFAPVLRGRGRALLPLALAGATGSAVGCVLLLTLPEAAFDVVVPALVFAASVLLALQPRITHTLGRRSAGRRDGGGADADPADVVRDARGAGAEPAGAVRGAPLPPGRLAVVTIGCAGVYGGYFGGAMGVVLLASLALTMSGELRTLNADKSLLSLVDCSVGVVAFALLGPVEWSAVAVAAPTGLVGGYLGARLARVVNERALRATVVTIGVAVAVWLAVG